MAHILVVDDAQDICAVIKMTLERDGHEVKTVLDPANISESQLKFADLILLDVMLPGEDGFSICSRIREETDCPILFLTAKSEEEDIVRGLSIGGDDYITKPFKIAQLRARVNAHLRREARVPVNHLHRGRLTFDLHTKTVYVDKEKISLTKSEYSICELLAEHKEQIYSKEQIYIKVFGYDGESDISAITEHIKNIRAKFKPFDLDAIETIWGVGYKWKKEKM